MNHQALRYYFQARECIFTLQYVKHFASHLDVVFHSLELHS